MLCDRQLLAQRGNIVFCDCQAALPSLRQHLNKCAYAAHVKSSTFGCSLSIPITNGRLNLGTWQVRTTVLAVCVLL